MYHCYNVLITWEAVYVGVQGVHGKPVLLISLQTYNLKNPVFKKSYRGLVFDFYILLMKYTCIL